MGLSVRAFRLASFGLKKLSSGVTQDLPSGAAGGHGISQIAHDLRVTEGSVWRWHWAWRDGGAGTLRSRC